MRDFSQNGEQARILEIFGGYVGRFLEIGACDGLLVSNTLALVELGWSGVMIEASPRAFISLQDRHGENPRLTLVLAAVGTDSRIVPFWDDPAIGGYSTTEEGNRQKWQHLASFKPPFFMPTLPVQWIVDSFAGPFDFLSIDTEGTSTDLFLEFPFDRVLPRVVCVEHDGRIGECLKRAECWGYREVMRNPENLVLVQG